MAAAILLVGCAGSYDARCPPIRSGDDYLRTMEASYRAGCISRELYERALANSKIPEAPSPTATPKHLDQTLSPSDSDAIPLQFVGKDIYVPVRINGTITIPFVLDTGANELALPIDVATTLARAGALDRNDILDPRRYTFANGASQTLQRVVIRQVQVGPHSIENVPASINPAASEPLLGQSFLARFGAVTIDYQRHLLILSR